MADQISKHPLGWLNPALYDLRHKSGIVDVTQGNNDIGPFTNSDGQTYHVPGFSAGSGYDLASGLGTINAQGFVPALARAGDKGPGD